MRGLPQYDWRFRLDKVKETSAYRLTQEWLETALDTPGIWLLIGESGTGKTWGAAAYAEQHSIPFVTPLAKGSENANAQLRYIASVVLPDYEQHRNPNYALLEWCLETYKPRLIIDEVSRLPRATLDALRDLTDRTPVSMVWIDTPKFEQKLKNNYYDTIVHRINQRFNVPTLTTSDIALVVGLDGEIARCLHEQTRGNFRHLTRILENLREMELTVPLVQAIAKQFLATWEE